MCIGANCIGEETLPILSGDKCRRLAEEIETTRQIKTQVQEDNKQLRDEVVVSEMKVEWMNRLNGQSYIHLFIESIHPWRFKTSIKAIYLLL